MSASGGDSIWTYFARARSAGDLQTILFRGLGAIAFAIGGALVSGILTIADLIIIPATALGINAGNIVNSIFGGAAQIINVGAITTALSIGPGGRFALGPFGFVLGIGAALLGFLAINRFLTIQTTSNFVPGLSFDIPYPAIDGPEEETNR